MKKILFLLLFTIASYGQAVFDEGIQITNTESTTATKVNVQEANGKVNTKTINTAFNKNFGLNSGDVVGANTLLNQYGTTPIDWTATTFASGQVVFYGGKQWISKMATVAGDVPAVSSKWGEITFEALANKTITVDSVPTDGSNNAVSSNGVFDGLATKSNIGHTHVASQITDLSKASVGLGNVDNTSDLSKPLSAATINALATKFPTPTGLTTNYLPKWNGSGFVDSLIDSHSGVTLISSTIDRVPLSIISNQIEATIGFKSQSSANIFNVRLGAEGEDFMFLTLNSERLRIKANGRVLINKTNDDLTNQLQVAGTISASPATTANQVPTWGQVQAMVKPYKVYTALLSQSGNNAPTVIVLENTLGGPITFERVGVGNYYAVSVGNLFTLDKTVVFNSSGQIVGTYNFYPANTSRVALYNVNVAGLGADSLMQKLSIEIRVYN